MACHGLSGEQMNHSSNRAEEQVSMQARGSEAPEQPATARFEEAKPEHQAEQEEPAQVAEWVKYFPPCQPTPPIFGG